MQLVKDRVRSRSTFKGCVQLVKDRVRSRSLEQLRACGYGWEGSPSTRAKRESVATSDDLEMVTSKGYPPTRWVVAIGPREGSAGLRIKVSLPQGDTWVGGEEARGGGGAAGLALRTAALRRRRR